MGHEILNHIFYADEFILLCPTRSGMQRLITICADAGLILDKLFNVTKTEAMILNKKETKLWNYAPMQLNDYQLYFYSKQKYLGHIIKGNMSDEEDIKSQIRQTYARGNSLINRFYMCSENVKTLLFKTYMSNLCSSKLLV